MTSPAQKYADRLIDTIRDCLTECSTADDADACVQQFIARLRDDPTWQASDADRVERVVLRTVNVPEPNGLKLWA
jgi:hypothetical protein